MCKYARKKTVVKCDNCNIDFYKDQSEVIRSKKLDRKNFCSRSCVGKSNSIYISAYQGKNNHRLNASNRTDEFTGFREHLRRIKYRSKDVFLTLDDMLEVWNKQDGICIYSKVKLEKCKYKGFNNPAYAMSLDRIDSKKGYIKDNIQFISIAMNHLKNSMTHEEMLEVLEIIKSTK